MRQVGELIVLMSLVAVPAIAIGVNAGTSERKGESRQAMEMPKPGPEMQKLNFLIGTWDMQAEYIENSHDRRRRKSHRLVQSPTWPRRIFRDRRF